jgi:RHS repeat-associated protein
VTVSGTGSSYTYYLTYDGLMNTTGVTDGAGHLVQAMTYTDINDPYEASTVTNGNGRVWTYRWDVFGRPLLIYSQRPNSANTNTVPYHQYAFSYDTFMYSPDREADPYLIPLISGMSEDNKNGVGFAYTNDGDSLEPPNLLKTYSYTQPSNTNSGVFVTASFVYDSQGNLAQIQQPTQNNSSGVTQYNTVTYSYAGTLNLLGRPYSMTDNNGKVWNMHYDLTTHDLKYVFDPNNNETQYTYDIANELQSVIAPHTGMNGGPGSDTIAYNRAFPGADPYSAVLTDEAGSTVRQMNWNYGHEGELLASTGDAQPFTATYDMLYRLKTLADGSGNITKYFYNNAGYLYQIAYPGAGAGTSPLAAGSRDTITYTGYDNDGNVTKRVDGRNNETDYAYADYEDYLTAVTYPSAFSTGNISYSYDANGRLTSQNDAAGNTLAYGYDLDDDLASTTTTYAGLPAKTISYTYNFDFTRATMTTPHGVYTYAYDPDRRLSSLTDPSSKVSSWTYRDNGWVASETGDNAITTSYTYWPNGLLSGTSLPGSSAFSSMVYDGAGNLTSMTGSIPPLYGSSNTLRYTYAYDTLGRLSREQVQPTTNNGVSFDGTGSIAASDPNLGNFGTSDFTISLWVKTTTATGTLVAKRQYCNVGNFYRFVVSGGKLCAEFDSNDLPSDIDLLGTATIDNGAWHHLVMERSGSTIKTYVDGAADAALTLPASYPYAFSTPTPLTLGNEVCNVPYTGQMDELRIYNYALSSSQISALAASGPVINASQGCIAYWSFDETSAGNYVDGSGDSNFGAPTGGISSTSGCPSSGYQSTYVYDNGAANGAGNPTSFAGVSRSYNADNQIVGVTYDNDGNPATAQGNSLSWDMEDRLTGAGGESISYRPDGLRGWQVDNGTTTYYLYDGDHPVQWVGSTIADLNDFQYGPLGLVAGGSGSLDNFSFDPLGNIISNGASGPPTQYKPQYPLDAWGTVGGTSVPSKNYGFKHDPAYNFNSGTGLIALGFRSYDPTTGRFLNRDPLGYGGGMNLYGYADDDPVNGIDPLGLYSIMPPGPGATLSDWWNATVGLAFPMAMVEKVDPQALEARTHQLFPWLPKSKSAPITNASGCNSLHRESPNFAMISAYGRRGSPMTRAQIENLADQLEDQGWRITHGARGLPEEYIPGGSGTLGSAYPDITAVNSKGEVLRVNTVDTMRNGVPTLRELLNGSRVIAAHPNDYFTMIPKP